MVAAPKIPLRHHRTLATLPSFSRDLVLLGIQHPKPHQVRRRQRGTKGGSMSASHTMSEPQVTVYTPESPLRHPGRMIRDLFADLWGFRELVWILFVRDLKGMYRQSFLGYAWILAPPIITTITWWFFQKQNILAKQDTDIPFPVYVLIGTLLWQTFADGLMNPLNSFQGGSAVFMKLKVPPEAFIAAGIARNVFNLLVRLVVILPIAFLLMRSLPPATALLFPLALLAILLVSTAFGLWLIPVGGLYSDISRGIGMALPFLMYTTPIVWVANENTGNTLALLAKYNPISPLIQCGRDWLTTGPSEHLPGLLLITLPSVLVLFLGLLLLRVAMPHLVVRMGM